MLCRNQGGGEATPTLTLADKVVGLHVHVDSYSIF